VTFAWVHAGKYRTEDKLKIQTKHNPETANNTKHSKTELPWFSRRLRHSATKQGGLKGLFYNAPDRIRSSKAQWRHNYTVFYELNTNTTTKNKPNIQKYHAHQYRHLSCCQHWTYCQSVGLHITHVHCTIHTGRVRFD